MQLPVCTIDLSVEYVVEMLVVDLGNNIDVDPKYFFHPGLSS